MEIFTDFPSPDHKSAHQRTYPPSPSGDVQGCTKIRERQDATQGRVNVASAGCAGATSRAIRKDGDEGTPALTLCPLPRGGGGVGEKSPPRGGGGEGEGGPPPPQ